MSFFDEVVGQDGVPRWPGFDWDRFQEMRGLTRRSDVHAHVTRLRRRCTLSGGKTVPLAPPVLITQPFADRLARFCGSYHRMVETIVARYQSDPRLQKTLTLPAPLRPFVERDQTQVDNRINLCRIDFYLARAGGFSVLETNANCPGGLVHNGLAARLWRGLSGDEGLPAPLAYEDTAWFGHWYRDLAKDRTGELPTELAIFREARGNRVELDLIAAELLRQGVAAAELEPHELVREAGGGVGHRGRLVRHGYLKLSIPEFCDMLDRSPAFVEAVLSGALFVPNGLLGRWVGDNKLCLAVISDPTFADLFEPADLACVRPHIPWSRNIAHCSASEIANIRSAPERFVLKRPLDTRGRGVVIGREARAASEWDSQVGRAIAEGWLVMVHLDPTFIESDDGHLRRHDLAIGLIDGVVSGGFVRSGPGLRVNVAQGGSVHSLYFDRVPRLPSSLAHTLDQPTAADLGDTMLPAH